MAEDYDGGARECALDEIVLELEDVRRDSMDECGLRDTAWRILQIGEEHLGWNDGAARGWEEKCLELQAENERLAEELDR